MIQRPKVGVNIARFITEKKKKKLWSESTTQHQNLHDSLFRLDTDTELEPLLFEREVMCPFPISMPVRSEAKKSNLFSFIALTYVRTEGLVTLRNSEETLLQSDHSYLQSRK